MSLCGTGFDEELIVPGKSTSMKFAKTASMEADPPDFSTGSRV